MTPLLKLAFDHAVLWHRDQLRKYPGVEIPYASHLAGVAAILSRHGFPDPVVAAGALHDAMEDQGVSYAELRRIFGSEVADLVQHCSEDDKSLPWEERKARYVAHFATKPWPAQAISLADKIDNFVSITVCAAHHGDPWKMFKRDKTMQIARFDALLARARELPPHALIDEYTSALDAIRSV